jgi:Transposase DDE domain
LHGRARRRSGVNAADFLEELRTLKVRPHVAQNTSGRRSAIDKRTTRHPSYGKSQRVRKRIEEALGWIKTVAELRKTKLRGLAKVGLGLHLRRCCL